MPAAKGRDVKKEEWILESFRERTSKSRYLNSEASALLPGGVTANVKHFVPYPIFMRRAAGSHLWDADGNEYIDYCLCFGPLILGHGPREVWRALEEGWQRLGTSLFGTPHEGEVEMARRLRSLYPAAEAVRFTNSGTEATMHALRLARAYTRKRKVAKFEGHYHGVHDSVLVSVSPKVATAGPVTSPRARASADSVGRQTLDNTVVLPFKDLDASLRRLRRNLRTIGAVILEPIARGYLAADREFLRGLREFTAERDIPLIFDEVMSGFRVGIGGAQEYFGVRPDLLALGKVLGGGLPMGAFAGRRDIMEIASPIGREPSRNLFHIGTYNGNPLATAAGLATLDVLAEAGVYEALNRQTEELKAGLQEVLRTREEDVQVLGLGSVFSVLFTSRPVRNYRDVAAADSRRRQLFDLGLLNRGIYVCPGKPFYLSTAHAAEEIARTIEAADAAAHDILHL
jgi:glutamate-1-semialdehyde 2,1-aminomutase